MRKIRRNYVDIPVVFTQAANLASWDKIARTGNTRLIKSSVYFDPYKTKDGNRSRVLDKLERAYKGKCAYCERLYKLDVEHYRPKGRITDENNKIIAKKGYYWLCYEWSNLLPSCISCNREGGKVDKFPILGVRVSLPPITGKIFDKTGCLVTAANLKAETPYLLNPEIDNPSSYFNFKISDNGKGIEIVGIDRNNRGEKTIKICKLNRYELRIQRGQVILEFAEAVHSTFKRLQNGIISNNQFAIGINNLLQTLYDNSKNNNLQHTLLRKKIVLNIVNFNLLVIPFLAKNIRTTVSVAFSNFTPL